MGSGASKKKRNKQPTADGDDTAEKKEKKRSKKKKTKKGDTDADFDNLAAAGGSTELEAEEGKKSKKKKKKDKKEDKEKKKKKQPKLEEEHVEAKDDSDTEASQRDQKVRYGPPPALRNKNKIISTVSDSAIPNLYKTDDRESGESEYVDMRDSQYDYEDTYSEITPNNSEPLTTLKPQPDVSLLYPPPKITAKAKSSTLPNMSTQFSEYIASYASTVDDDTDIPTQIAPVPFSSKKPLPPIKPVKQVNGKYIKRRSMPPGSSSNNDMGMGAAGQEPMYTYADKPPVKPKTSQPRSKQRNISENYSEVEMDDDSNVGPVKQPIPAKRSMPTRPEINEREIHSESESHDVNSNTKPKGKTRRPPPTPDEKGSEISSQIESDNVDLSTKPKVNTRRLLPTPNKKYEDYSEVDIDEDSNCQPVETQIPVRKPVLNLTVPEINGTEMSSDIESDDVDLSTKPKGKTRRPLPTPNKKYEDYSEVEIDEDSNFQPEAMQIPVQTPVPTLTLPEINEDAPNPSTEDVQTVVAIDFGTTFTGYAYSHVISKDDIKLNPTWPGGFTSKTPTCVAFGPDGKVLAFGFDAQNQFYGGVDDQERQDMSYYEHFKLELMKENLNENTEIATDYGRAINAVQLFAGVLSHLKTQILHKFSTEGYNFCAGNIRWVLTVPAIWEDKQKIFMRKAAKEAGLISELDSENLLIALEPEAASLYCRSLKMNCFKNCRGTQMLSLPPGSVYMVIDAGGGTIDITVHKVLDQDKTTEIHQAKGGPWGGSKVNGRFEFKIKSILGEEFMNACKRDNPVCWLELMRDFELAKQSDNAKPGSDKPLKVKCGLGLSNAYSDFSGVSITDTFKEQENSGISMNRQGEIQINPDNVRSIFNTVIVNTVSLLETLFKKPEISETKMIFIVGGFGQCPYLQEEIRSQFSSRSRTVLIPAEGSLCVLRGAVMFGHKSDFISTRVAKCTYAYLTTRQYDPNTDSNRHRYAPPNDDLVSCLQSIIQKDDHIGIDDEIIKDFFVQDEEFILDIFSSENREVDDPESNDVTKIGALKIRLPINNQRSGTEEEEVRVFFKLGTELKVKGTHLASNTTAETVLRLVE